MITRTALELATRSGLGSTGLGWTRGVKGLTIVLHHDAVGAGVGHLTDACAAAAATVAARCTARVHTHLEEVRSAPRHYNLEQAAGPHRTTSSLQGRPQWQAMELGWAHAARAAAAAAAAAAAKRREDRLHMMFSVREAALTSTRQGPATSLAPLAALGLNTRWQYRRVAIALQAKWATSG